ncbi:hypothetical protein BH09CHL1_BH09CHL1_28480 [soil metagenome]
MRGCVVGVILGFIAMLGTIAAAAFGLVAVAAWYIDRNLVGARTNLSIRPSSALIAAALCGVGALLAWIVLIVVSRRNSS